MVSKHQKASQSYSRAFVELINRFACESNILCPYCPISETLQNPGSVSFSSRCLIFKVHPPNFLDTLSPRRSVLDYNIKSLLLCQAFFLNFFQVFLLLLSKPFPNPAKAEIFALYLAFLLRICLFFYKMWTGLTFFFLYNANAFLQPATYIFLKAVHPI